MCRGAEQGTWWSRYAKGCAHSSTPSRDASHPPGKACRTEQGSCGENTTVLSMLPGLEARCLLLPREHLATVPKQKELPPQVYPLAYGPHCQRTRPLCCHACLLPPGSVFPPSGHSSWPAESLPQLRRSCSMDELREGVRRRQALPFPRVKASLRAEDSEQQFISFIKKKKQSKVVVPTFPQGQCPLGHCAVGAFAT